MRRAGWGWVGDRTVQKPAYLELAHELANDVAAGLDAMGWRPRVSRVAERCDEGMVSGRMEAHSFPMWIVNCLWCLGEELWQLRLAAIVQVAVVGRESGQDTRARSELEKRACRVLSQVMPAAPSPSSTAPATGVSRDVMPGMRSAGQPQVCRGREKKNDLRRHARGCCP